MFNVSPHFAQVIITSAKRQGIELEHLYAACSITSQDIAATSSGIAPEKFCRLLQFLWDELDDEFLGFTKKPSRRGTFTLACKVACQTKNLQQLFKEVNRIYQLVDSDLLITLTPINSEQSALRLINHSPSYNIKHFVTEYFLFYWHRLACWVSDRKIKPLRAEFSYPKPEHVKLYQDIFQCPLVFNAEQDALIFDEDFKSIKPIRTRLELYEFLNRLPADFMSLPGKDTSLTTQIKMLILDNSKHQLTLPPLEQLAKKLSMSRTSLGRKLAAENTNYRQLKELIRRDMAIEKLSLTTMSITDIAQVIGFTEAASLTRAFKQWTGMTPLQFRGNTLNLTDKPQHSKTSQKI